MSRRRDHLALKRRLRANELEAPVAVEQSPDKGQCLVATRRIEPGAVIFRERPLCAAQYMTAGIDGATDTSLACYHCLAPVGSLSTQFAHLAKLDEEGGALEVPLAKEAVGDEGKGPIRCKRGCGAYFCSKACALLAETSYHWALCPGSNEAAGMYVQNAQKIGGEYFMLAGRIIATALSDETDGLKCVAEPGQADAMRSLLRTVEEMSGEAISFEWTLSKREVVEAGFADGDFYATVRKHTAVMADLLTHCLSKRMPEQSQHSLISRTAAVRGWLVPEKLGLLLGRLRLNCQKVRVPSKLHRYFEYLAQRGSEDEPAATAALEKLDPVFQRIRTMPHFLRAFARVEHENASGSVRGKKRSGQKRND